MKKLTWLLLAWVCLYAPPVFAQGGIDLTGTVQNSRGIPVGGARITVCAEAAGGNPCSPGGTLYSDVLLTTPISTVDHAFTDGLGNYHFFVPFGTYRVSISGNGIATTTITRVLSGGGGGGGGGGNGTTTCMMTFGSDGGPALTDADLNQKAVCEVPFVPTITTVIVMADAGATRFQLDYRHNNTAFGITSPALIPATVVGIGDKVACANTAGTVIVIQGVNVTCTTLLATTTFAGDWLESDPSGTPADGVTKRISVAVLMTGNGGGGGGGGGSVTSIGTTAPLTGGLITTTGAVACPTCTTSAAALANNQIISGAGGQGTKANNLSGDVTTTGTMVTTIGAGTVTEAKQSLSDNTTQNVSTARHGYVPKLSGDATTFLSGAGTFLPGGGSSVSLRTNGVTNPTQSLLNLTQSAGLTLSDNGSGQITMGANAFITPNAHVLYAAPWGSDSTGDGKSPGTAFYTIYHALCTLPGGNCSTQHAGTGTVAAYDGTHANPTANAGIWLQGAFALGGAGWLIETGAVRILGVDANGNSQGGAVTVSIVAGGSGVDDHAIYMAGTSAATSFENIAVSSRANVWMSGATSVTFRNFHSSVAQNGIDGPGVFIGPRCFWVRFYNSLLDGDAGGPDTALYLKSDIAQAVVIDPVSDEGTGIEFHDTNLQGGGVKWSPGTTTAGLLIDNMNIEDNLWAGVYFPVGVPAADTVSIAHLYVSDCGSTVPGACAAVDNTAGSAAAALTTSDIQSPQYGALTHLGNNNQLTSGTANKNPFYDHQKGLIGSGLYSQTDVARRAFPPVKVRFSSIFSGLSQAICSAGSTATGYAAPDGSLEASRFTSTDIPTNGGCTSIYFGAHTQAPGDWIIVGAWVRNTVVGTLAPQMLYYFTNGSGCEVSYGTYADIGKDGEYVWTSTACKLNSASTVTGDFSVYVQTYPGDPLDIFSPVVNWIPAGTISDDEVLQYFNALQSYSPLCSVGTMCTSTGPLPTGITSATDDFNRANASTLGAQWATPSTAQTLKIVSNAASASVTGVNLGYYSYSGVTIGADQCSSVTVKASANVNDYMGPAVRMQASGQNLYTLYWSNNGASTAWYLANIISGSFNVLSTGTFTLTVGDEIKVCASGSSLAGYQNGVSIAGATATDTTFTTGLPGMLIYNTTGTLNNTLIEEWAASSSGELVTSVNGRNGAVTLTLADVAAGISPSGLFNFSGSTIKLPLAAGFATTANGNFGYDTTGLNWQAWQNGANHIVGVFDATSTVNGHCVQILKSGSTLNLQDSGDICGGGGGGGGTFADITNGTNTTAAMVVGSGATLGVSGTGSITANALASGSITSAQLATALTDETGTGLAVFGTSPTLTTPTIGAATATSINKMAITAPATSSTLAVANGKTFTASNTLTLAGTDSTTLTFQGTDTYVGRATTDTLTNKTLTAPVIGTIVNTGTLTLPTSTDTLVGRATTDTLTNKTLTTPTIGSFTNATHNHTNAAGGGQITDSALSAPVGFAKGGTGLSTAADDTILISSGSGFVATAVPPCLDTGSNHLNYNASNNTVICGTGGGSGTVTTSGTPSANQAAEFTSSSAITGVATAGGGTSYLKGTITSAVIGEFPCWDGTPKLVNCKSGTVTNAQTGTTYTVLTGDRNKYISYSNGSAVAVTLPQAGSAGFTLNFTHVAANLGAGAVTYTPTTSTINGSSTLVITQGQTCAIYSDNTNYLARCNSGQISAGTGLSATPSAVGTTLSLSAPVAIASGGTNTTSPAYSSITDAATLTFDATSALIANRNVLFTVHSGSRTLNATNMVNGGSYVATFQQDSTGGEGLTLGTGCTWKVSGGGAGAVTPSTGANKIDVLAWTYDGTNCYANFNKDFN